MEWVIYINKRREKYWRESNIDLKILIKIITIYSYKKYLFRIFLNSTYLLTISKYLSNKEMIVKLIFFPNFNHDFVPNKYIFLCILYNTYICVCI